MTVQTSVWTINRKKKAPDRPQRQHERSSGPHPEKVEKKTENPSPLRERTLGTQLERMMEIPALMDDLLEMEESPTQIEF